MRPLLGLSHLSHQKWFTPTTGSTSSHTGIIAARPKKLTLAIRRFLLMGLHAKLRAKRSQKP
ncbi:hypothetical protein MESS2_300079 [Mesorhizobium metallidurans STM 2683]|uniref:Uncharacterized protein n=1 Tax=Mesorhizobium metallidurans STM 2683 TaxID=1297569 RepID=M5F3F6_9HYPH|nr:hypothetical protein MESS2_300079 [Mesorhizobium metallidurans STM 2683]